MEIINVTIKYYGVWGKLLFNVFKDFLCVGKLSFFLVSLFVLEIKINLICGFVVYFLMCLCVAYGLRNLS